MTAEVEARSLSFRMEASKVSYHTVTGQELSWTSMQSPRPRPDSPNEQGLYPEDHLHQKKQAESEDWAGGSPPPTFQAAIKEERKGPQWCVQ